VSQPRPKFEKSVPKYMHCVKIHYMEDFSEFLPLRKEEISV
jgi:hypothetical protein